MITLSGLVTAIIVLIVAGLIFWLLWWLINFVGLPEPFRKIATVILAVAAVLICIAVLMSLIGHPLIILDR